MDEGNNLDPRNSEEDDLNQDSDSDEDYDPKDDDKSEEKSVNENDNNKNESNSDSDSDSDEDDDEDYLGERDVQDPGEIARVTRSGGDPNTSGSNMDQNTNTVVTAAPEAAVTVETVTEDGTEELAGVPLAENPAIEIPGP